MFGPCFVIQFFITVPWVGLRCVIVEFSLHTHLLLLWEPSVLRLDMHIAGMLWLDAFTWRYCSLKK